MFDFIRKHTKVTMWLLFLLIVPSFVLLGMNDHTRTTGTAAVAQVDGREITQAEWDAAHRSEIDRLRASMPSLDIKLLDSPEARYATLERLVSERVMAAAADKFYLGASDQRLARELQNNPQIAALRKKMIERRPGKLEAGILVADTEGHRRFFNGHLELGKEPRQLGVRGIIKYHKSGIDRHGVPGVFLGDGHGVRVAARVIILLKQR